MQNAGTPEEMPDSTGGRHPFPAPCVRRRVVLAAALALLLAAGGVCLLSRWLRLGTDQSRADRELLARVGMHEIRLPEFRREMGRRGGARADKRALLDEMVRRQALLAEAGRRGLAEDPDVVRQRENLLLGALRQRVLEPQLNAVTVTETEASTYYEQHIATFTTPAKRRLALLYIRTHPKMTETQLAERRARANAARAAALRLPVSESSQGFGAVAVEFSEDQATRYKGGDIGWVVAGQDRYRWPTAVVEAGLALRGVGEISDVLIASDGFYVVKVLDERSPGVTPFESVAERIRHTLLLEKRKKTEHAFDQRILKAVPVEIFPEALDGVTCAPPAAPAKRGPPPLTGN